MDQHVLYKHRERGDKQCFFNKLVQAVKRGATRVPSLPILVRALDGIIVEQTKTRIKYNRNQTIMERNQTKPICGRYKSILCGFDLCRKFLENILLVFKKIYSCLFILNCTGNHVITYTINWFYVINNTKFHPSREERLFSITSDPQDKGIIKKFNYAMLFMRYFVYTNKLDNKPISLQDVVDKIFLKYKIENTMT